MKNIDIINRAINNTVWASLKRDRQEIRIWNTTSKDASNIITYGVRITLGELTLAEMTVIDTAVMEEMVNQWEAAGWKLMHKAWFQGWDAYVDSDDREGNPYPKPYSQADFFQQIDSDWVLWDRGYSAAEAKNRY